MIYREMFGFVHGFRSPIFWHIQNLKFSSHTEVCSQQIKLFHQTRLNMDISLYLGLLSTLEAIWNSVPMVIIPILLDQITVRNMRLCFLFVSFQKSLFHLPFVEYEQSKEFGNFRES